MVIPIEDHPERFIIAKEPEFELHMNQIAANGRFKLFDNITVRQDELRSEDDLSAAMRKLSLLDDIIDKIVDQIKICRDLQQPFPVPNVQMSRDAQLRYKGLVRRVKLCTDQKTELANRIRRYMEMQVDVMAGALHPPVEVAPSNSGFSKMEPPYYPAEVEPIIPRLSYRKSIRGATILQVPKSTTPEVPKENHIVPMQEHILMKQEKVVSNEMSERSASFRRSKTVVSRYEKTLNEQSFNGRRKPHTPATNKRMSKTIKTKTTDKETPSAPQAPLSEPQSLNSEVITTPASVSDSTPQETPTSPPETKKRRTVSPVRELPPITPMSTRNRKKGRHSKSVDAPQPTAEEIAAKKVERKESQKMKEEQRRDAEEFARITAQLELQGDIPKRRAAATAAVQAIHSVSHQQRPVGSNPVTKQKTPPVITSTPAVAVPATTSKRRGGVGVRQKKKKEEDMEQEEETYCTCKQISYGEMVACDNDECAIQWFHFGCVGLKIKPKKGSNWYCPSCRGDRASVMKKAVTVTA